MKIFDKAAENYDDWYGMTLGAFAAQVEFRSVKRLLRPKRGMGALDVGCGTGHFTFKLAREGLHVTGIDISLPMLEKAREKARKKVREEATAEETSVLFLEKDVHNLDIQDENFDRVMAITTFEFLKDPLRAFSECMRVLKRGGKFCIGTIHRDSQWGDFYRQVAREDPESVFNHANFFNREALKKLDRENLVEIEESLFLPPDIQERDIGWEAERAFAKQNKGGFLTALWEKK